MTLGVPELIAEAGRKRHLRTSVSQEEMLKIWDRIAGYVEIQLNQNKGVVIPGLGTMSFAKSKLEIGNKGHKVIQRPVFVINETFAATFKIHHTKQRASGSIPVIDLNMTQIATELGFTRDDIAGTVKEVVHTFGLACSKGVDAAVAFHDFARIACRNGRVDTLFAQHFVDAHNGGEPTMTYRAESPQKGGSHRLPPLAHGRSVSPSAKCDSLQVSKVSQSMTAADVAEASRKPEPVVESEPAARDCAEPATPAPVVAAAAESQSSQAPAALTAGHVHRGILIKGSSLLPRRAMYNPDYAKALEEQITYQRDVATKMKQQEEQYDRAVLAQLEQTMDQAELNYLEVHKKRRDDYSHALAEQISARKDIQGDKCTHAAFMDAVFTRPESYVAQVQAERRARARDFFAEQVTMMQTKREEIAAREAREREDMAQHLERVRDELRREFHANHHTAYEARKKIENYWAIQVESRQATMRADKTAESSPANCLQLRKQYSQRTPQQERQLWAFRRMVNAGLFFKA